MEPSAVIIAGAIALLIAIVVSHMRAEKKLRMKLESGFGHFPPKPEFKDDISTYWRLKEEHAKPAHYIDDITWNDLDMDKVLLKINACQTTAGEEYLYALLREPVFDESALKEREALYALLDKDKEKRLDLQVLLAKSGKLRNDLPAFFWETASRRIKHPWVYNIMAVLPLLCAGVLLVHVGIGAALIGLAAVTNGAVFYRVKKRLDTEMAAVRYFSILLWCARMICKTHVLDDHPVGKDMKESFGVFKKLGGRLSGMLRERVGDLDAFYEYYRLLTLKDIRSYNRITAVMEKNTEHLQRLYCSIGAVDAAIAVLSYRKSIDYFCKPEFIYENRIETENIYHPLLAKPVPNSASLNPSSLVSGSNASGKSTFIKAVAICGILAQTLHTCTARRFCTRPVLVMTSMAVRDDITANESYFMTEIKSLLRILKKIPDVHCACYIDEILKGTNTIERIAASVAVLGFLRKLDCLCMVATHDIELTQLLGNSYDNYHFRESMSDSGIEFDYRIYPGPSRTRNAILLLDHLGFEPSITQQAMALAARFDKTKSWEE